MCSVYFISRFLICSFCNFFFTSNFVIVLLFIRFYIFFFKRDSPPRREFNYFRRSVVGGFITADSVWVFSLVASSRTRYGLSPSPPPPHVRVTWRTRPAVYSRREIQVVCSENFFFFRKYHELVKVTDNPFMSPAIVEALLASDPGVIKRNKRRGKPWKRPGKNYRDKTRRLAQFKAALPLSPLKALGAQTPSRAQKVEIVIQDLLRTPNCDLPSAKDLFQRDNIDVSYIPTESSPEKFTPSPVQEPAVSARRVLF